MTEPKLIKVEALPGEPWLFASGEWIVLQTGEGGIQLRGPFKNTKEEAAQAWNEMARRLNGDG